MYTFVKHASACLIVLMMHRLGYGQENPRAILEAIVNKAKETSMYTGTVNWDSLQTEIYTRAERVTTLQDLKPAFETLINGLRDHHARILDAHSYATLAYFTDYQNQRHRDNRTKDMETWKIVNDTALKFDYSILQGNIGYLKIVGIAPWVDIQKEAGRIRGAVAELSKKKVKKWIVDLRYNGGGNMYPMVTGIGTLIGDGIVGKLVSSNHDTLFDWKIEGGNFIYDIPDVIHLKNKPRFRTLPPIAVLTSRWTASSGEVLATCLKGRPHTRFFGESTGGYATNVGWEIVGDSIILAISTGIYCDRNGTVYEFNLPADVEIPFEVIADPEKDPCILEARKWLVGQ